MKKIIRVHQSETSPLNLTWMINNICTNSCSYCPDNLHNGKNHYYEWKNAKRFFEILFERYPRIHCSVSGGEPSVSPFFMEICKTFYEAGHTIGITSNAAKPVAYWKEIAPYLAYASFSWHPEFPDKNFEAKIMAVAEIIPVTVRIMMMSLDWERCLEAYNYYSSIPEIITEPVKILNHKGANMSAHYYTHEYAEWFKKNLGNHRSLTHFKQKVNPVDIGATYYFDDGTNDGGGGNASDYVNHGMTNFNGYTCEIGLRSLCVKWDGSLYLGNCLVGGMIGNINDPENIKWPTQSIKCNIDLCDCSSDVNINKWIE